MAEYLPYEKSQTTSVPVVSITWPADGETISGTQIVDPIGGGPINAVAYSVFDDTMTDGTGIASVLFELIDSESNVVAQHNEGLVAYDWDDLDTTQYPDGAYTLRATATGNTQPPYRSQDEITVNIDNGP